MALAFVGIRDGSYPYFIKSSKGYYPSTTLFHVKSGQKSVKNVVCVGIVTPCDEGSVRVILKLF